ncbi:ribonuclease H [Senna tora]|uniref:Ribonuclease H n=1 Tax=Senna tora TaxID=362788 RepID=A0A834WXS0_9FABA|nr:ribonuclease H [Senna tora]
MRISSHIIHLQGMALNSQWVNYIEVLDDDVNGSPQQGNSPSQQDINVVSSSSDHILHQLMPSAANPGSLVAGILLGNLHGGDHVDMPFNHHADLLHSEGNHLTTLPLPESQHVSPQNQNFAPNGSNHFAGAGALNVMDTVNPPVRGVAVNTVGTHPHSSSSLELLMCHEDPEDFDNDVEMNDSDQFEDANLFPNDYPFPDGDDPDITSPLEEAVDMHINNPQPILQIQCGPGPLPEWAKRKSSLPNDLIPRDLVDLETEVGALSVFQLSTRVKNLFRDNYMGWGNIPSFEDRGNDIYKWATANLPPDQGLALVLSGTGSGTFNWDSHEMCDHTQCLVALKRQLPVVVNVYTKRQKSSVLISSSSIPIPFKKRKRVSFHDSVVFQEHHVSYVKHFRLAYPKSRKLPISDSSGETSSERTFRNIGYSCFTGTNPVGRSGGTFLAWQEDQECNIIDISPNWIHISTKDESGNDCVLTFIYGFLDLGMRSILWNWFRNVFIIINVPWAAIGDFNQISSLGRMAEEVMMLYGVDWIGLFVIFYGCNPTPLDNNGQWIDDYKVIEHMGVEYFRDTFRENNTLQVEEIIQQLGKYDIPVLLQSHLDILNKPFSMDECLSALNQMKLDGAADPDGFNVRFFRNYWDIVKEDAHAMLNIHGSSSSINEECIIPFLIPSGVKNNCGTSSGINIGCSSDSPTGNRATATNSSNSSSTRDSGGSGENSSPSTSSSHSKSLSHDPLSQSRDEELSGDAQHSASNPSLLGHSSSPIPNEAEREETEAQTNKGTHHMVTRAKDGIRKPKKQEDAKLWRGVKIGRRSTTLSHLMYADDTLLFFEANDHNCRAIKHVINEYANLAGQQMNTSKPFLVFSPNINHARKRDIAGFFNLRFHSTLGKYLGTWIDCRESKKNVIQETIAKIKHAQA